VLVDSDGIDYCNRYIKEDWADGGRLFKDFWKNADLKGRDWQEPRDWRAGNIVMALPGYFGDGDWLVGKPDATRSLKSHR
jgi:hypothetical protein